MGVEQTEFSVKDLMFVQHTFLQALLIWRYTWKIVTVAAPTPTPAWMHGHLRSLLCLPRIMRTGGLTRTPRSFSLPLFTNHFWCVATSLLVERASSHLFHSLATRKTDCGLRFLGCP